MNAVIRPARKDESHQIAELDSIASSGVVDFLYEESGSGKTARLRSWARLSHPTRGFLAMPIPLLPMSGLRGGSGHILPVAPPGNQR